MTNAMRQTASAASLPRSIEADPIDDAVDLDYTPRTELGRLALAARREYLASGGLLLSADEIAQEVAERRGGTHRGDDR